MITVKTATTIASPGRLPPLRSAPARCPCRWGGPLRSAALGRRPAGGRAGEARPARRGDILPAQPLNYPHLGGSCRAVTLRRDKVAGGWAGEDDTRGQSDEGPHMGAPGPDAGATLDAPCFHRVVPRLGQSSGPGGCRDMLPTETEPPGSLVCRCTVEHFGNSGDTCTSRQRSALQRAPCSRGHRHAGRKAHEGVPRPAANTVARLWRFNPRWIRRESGA